MRGDVLLSNHPCAGGSHLPDLTVITPVRLRLPFTVIISTQYTSTNVYVVSYSLII